MKKESDYEKEEDCERYFGERRSRKKKEHEGETEQSRKNWLIEKSILSLCFLFAVLALVKGVEKHLPDAVVVNSSVNGRNLPIYCVQTDEKKIALTFDAAWGNEDTAQILEILEKHDVHVTFFMTGGWVENYPEDVKAILAAGHDLGNHSENHKNMSQISDEEKRQEIMTVHDRVKELTGYEMFLFRPPYGDYDNAVIRVSEECGYYPIQWDVDSLVIKVNRRIVPTVYFFAFRNKPVVEKRTEKNTYCFGE